MMTNKVDTLRDIFNSNTLNVTPCCWDALSAKLIEQAGFPLAFMSGFGVSAFHLGLPDTGLISSTEMINQARNITAVTSIPLIGDGDTGYGNPLNVKKTVNNYAQAGVACIMIEDQLSPKRCGHTQGKQVVDRAEACMRIQAAVDARNAGSNILILARTDARESLGLDEAITRANLFRDIGADMTFIEAPKSINEMAQICDQVKGPKMANMLEGGMTPFLDVTDLQDLGFSIAAYPFTTMMGAIKAIQDALGEMKSGKFPKPQMSFDDLQQTVGFNDYYQQEDKYKI